MNGKQGKEYGMRNEKHTLTLSMLMAKVVGLRKPSSQNTHGGEDFRNTCEVLQ